MSQVNPQGEAARSPAQDPAPHVAYVRQRLTDLADHLALDEQKVDEPTALALFETTREVLKGLASAFAHYAEGKERVWRPSSDT